MSILPNDISGRRLLAAAVPVYALLLLTSLTAPLPARAQDQPPAPAPAAPPVTPPAPGTPPADVSLPPAPITVTVNGQGIDFATQPPVEQQGSILVPLRGVFEKLGAGVQYAAETKTITAVKGDTTVTLRLGDPYAFINGTPRPLSVVPQALNGVTLVPLRFVSEALGAHVAWKKDTRTVEITTGVTVADQLPTPPGTDPVLGSVTGIFPEANYLTLRLPGGENNRLPLAPGALLLVKDSDDGPETSAPLGSLKNDSQITVTRDDQGRGTVIRMRTDQRRGPLKSIMPADGGEAVVTLTDGSVVTVVSGAPVTMAGRSVLLADVIPDENVIIRLDPRSGKGIGIAVATQDDPNPVPPFKLEVASVTLGPGADRTLRAGDTLNVILTGTPGAKAAFSIVGLDSAQNVAMDEASPGNYVGKLAIPKDVMAKDAVVQGVLANGENVSAAVPASGTINIDAAPPKLESVGPADGSATNNPRVPIYGTFSDPGSGVDTGSLRLSIDSKDVTAQAQVTDSAFTYTPPAALAQGKHTIEVRLKDTAGNETRQTWAFDVAAPSNPIRALTVTPDDGTPLNVGDTLQVRIDAPSGGDATFRIPGIVSGRGMPDKGGGVYIGTYTVKAGDTVSHAPVTVTFNPPGGGPPVLETATAQVTFAAGPPVAPIIDRPQEGISVGNAVNVTGRARPYAKVRVTIAYTGKVVVLPSQGTLLQAEVSADGEGKWSTDTVNLNVPSNVAGVTLIVTAVTIGPDGAISDPATVKCKK